MLDDTRLAKAREEVAEVERAARHHIAATPRAEEQARAHLVVRHATALRKVLDDWTEERRLSAAHGAR